ncbi:unnamed protein product [Brachionus calyciflorus]|uniref:Uncharacterized protein n=1 Tax=Brachionus calyciflorus TaxID=104777 RepID=A0A814D4D9_9BILA|nr:unnamed protein product [Brachionus calyciflorus]
MLLFLEILSFIWIVNADSRCPFQSCSTAYDSYSGCSITCNYKKFPDVGPITFNKIEYLILNNLENIPKNAFQGLVIHKLSINSQNLTQIDDGAFENIGKLDRIILDRIKNFSNFFENNRIEALSNITNHISLTNAGFNNESVIPIINKFRSWPRLQSLTISYNNFSHFSYDFTNFSSLSSLDLSNNLIETFDIKSNRLSNLNLFFNKITILEKEMFFYCPNLRYLGLAFNKIPKILNDSFQSTKFLSSIHLDYNKINYIEPNSFCDLKFINSLYLSGNNLSDISLYCLENVRYLFLGSVQFKGEIDQKRLGNPINIIQLYLSNNKISKINFENMTNLKYLYLDSNELVNFTLKTIQAFPNLGDLRLEKNQFLEKSLENFNQLKKLQYLYLSNNLLTKFEHHMLAENKELFVLGIDSNNIEIIEFGSLPNLKQLYLSYNKIKFIDKDSFSKLSNLERLSLESNIISSIHPKAFASNSNLAYLDLRYNNLTTTPDISELKVLNTFYLNNNKLTSLPNHAFERKLNEANPLKSNIKIDLRGNSINRFTSKTFCSQHASSLGFLGFELQMNDINQMDYCMLRQFNSDKMKIVSNVKPSCEHLLMAKRVNIELNGNVSLCENLQINLDKECYSNSKFKCTKGDELVRYTTWITGDPHLYSYKNKYELCSTGENAVCFQHRDFKILCTDFYAGGSNLQATVLTSLKFIYQVSDSEQVAYEANRTSFPNKFDNGLLNIFEDQSNKNKLAELVNTENGTKVIYIPNSNVHIFISQWNSFYSIYIRTTHETYSESTGLLYEGCPLKDQLVSRKKRQINQMCASECSNIQFSIEEENMPEDVIRDACLFDCNEIGIGATSMIKSMVKKIETLILSDVYTDLVFPEPETTLKDTFEETTFIMTTDSSTTTESIITDELTTQNKIDLTTKENLHTDLTHSQSPVTSIHSSTSTSSSINQSTEELITSNKQTTSTREHVVSNTTETVTTETTITTAFLTYTNRLTTIIATTLSTKENVMTNSTLFQNPETSIVLLTTSIKSSSTETATYPPTSLTSTQITTKSNENKLSFSLREVIAFSSAAVFLVVSIILLIIVCKIKKNTRIGNIDDTEMKRLRY